MEQAASIREESVVLIRFLRGLSGDDWNRSTGLGEWEVRDIVAHLADRAIGFYSATMALGLKGEVSEPPGFNLIPIADSASGRQNIADRAIERRTDDMEPLIEQLDQLLTDFWKMQSELRPEDLDKPCWTLTGTRMVREIGPIIVQEIAVHSLDIRSQFDTRAHLAPESLTSLADRIIWVLETQFPQSVPPEISLDISEARPVSYRLTISNMPSGQRDLILNQRKARMEHSSGAGADAMLECDSETFVLLLFKRITPEAAIENGDLKVAGPEELLLEFNAWLNNVTLSNMQ
jgi:uncharacterized protein (TIGR03083 family)